MKTTQSNTILGALVLIAAAALTDKEGRLLTLTSTGVNLPAAIGDRVPYLLTEAESATSAVVEPFEASSNRRVRCTGTGDKGTPLCLSAIAGDDAGKLRALPSANGTYHVVAIAEEAFVADQLTLVRPVAREAVVINN